MSTQQQFYLTLPSNGADFESNKSSNFRVRLPNPLELNGEWECGLAQIDYPHSFDNVTNAKTRVGGLTENSFVIKLRRLSEDQPNLLLRFTVPRGSYDTVQRLVEAVNYSIEKTQLNANHISAYNSKKVKLAKTLKWYWKQKVKLGSPLFLAYNESTRRVHFNFKWGIKSVLFSPKLQYILGIASERWVQVYPSGFISDYPPDLTAGFNTLFIYCSLIEPQIVGNSLSPLLQTVAIRGKQGDFVSSVFQNPHYVKIKTKSFDVVDVTIRDDTGEDVKFNFGKVIVKLHLRQIVGKP